MLKTKKIILDRYGIPDLKVSTNPLTGREFLVEWAGVMWQKI